SRRWATSAGSVATASRCRWTRARQRRGWICPAARTSCSTAASRANAWARCPPSWCRTSSARCAKRWARTCTSRYAARTHTTWSRPASRWWRARCVRRSAAKATNCPAPRGACDAAFHAHGCRSAPCARCFPSRDEELSRTGCAPTWKVHMTVVLVDAGGTNIGSVRYALQRLVVLLRSLTRPVLGVCLGMQLLCAHSEEGNTECLGLIPAKVQRFAERPGLHVPHMGWNQLSVQREHPLLAGLDEGGQAYFVHSYAAPVGEWTLATVDYGAPFSAVVARGNFHGMQFHPERSAAVGAKLLKNFLEL